MLRPMSETQTKKKLNEDWLAVMIAFGLIILSVVGLIGKSGINITF